MELQPSADKCSFCSKHLDEVFKIIAGPGVYICNECVTLCSEIIGEERCAFPNRPEVTTPGEIEQLIVAGLPGDYWKAAIQRLSRALSRHLDDDEPHPRHHVLLRGPAGSGKTTLLTRTVKSLGLPSLILDLSKFVGEHDLAISYRDLLDSANFDLSVAGQGVILLDGLETVSKPEMESQLLQLLDGKTVWFSPPGRTNQELNTGRILFLASTRNPVLISQALLSRFPVRIRLDGPNESTIHDWLQADDGYFRTYLRWLGKYYPDAGISDDFPYALARAASDLGTGGFAIKLLLETIDGYLVGPSAVLDAGLVTRAVEELGSHSKGSGQED